MFLVTPCYTNRVPHGSLNWIRPLALYRLSYYIFFSFKAGFHMIANVSSITEKGSRQRMRSVVIIWKCPTSRFRDQAMRRNDTNSCTARFPYIWSLSLLLAITSWKAAFNNNVKRTKKTLRLKIWYEFMVLWFRLFCQRRGIQTVNIIKWRCLPKTINL